MAPLHKDRAHIKTGAPNDVARILLFLLDCDCCILVSLMIKSIVFVK